MIFSKNTLALLVTLTLGAAPLVSANAALKFDHTLSNTRALHKTSLEHALQTIAAVHQFSVIAPSDLNKWSLSRNLTILGAHPTEDVRLLARVLGGEAGPYSYKVDLNLKTLTVSPKKAGTPLIVTVFDPLFQGKTQVHAITTLSREVASADTFPGITASTVHTHQETIVPHAPVAPAPMEEPSGELMDPNSIIKNTVQYPDPVVATPAPLEHSTGPVVAVAAPALTEIVAPSPADATATDVLNPKTKMTLKLEKGQMLSDAIRKFLDSEGWKLEWSMAGEDLMAGGTGEYTGESYVDVFNQVLPKLGLFAEIYRPSKVVVIKPRVTP